MSNVKIPTLTEGCRGCEPSQDLVSGFLQRAGKTHAADLRSEPFCDCPSSCDCSGAANLPSGNGDGIIVLCIILLFLVIVAGAMIWLWNSISDCCYAQRKMAETKKIEDITKKTNEELRPLLNLASDVSDETVTVLKTTLTKAVEAQKTIDKSRLSESRWRLIAVICAFIGVALLVWGLIAAITPLIIGGSVLFAVSLLITLIACVEGSCEVGKVDQKKKMCEADSVYKILHPDQIIEESDATLVELPKQETLLPQQAESSTA